MDRSVRQARGHAPIGRAGHSRRRGDGYDGIVERSRPQPTGNLRHRQAPGARRLQDAGLAGQDERFEGADYRRAAARRRQRRGLSPLIGPFGARTDSAARRKDHLTPDFFHIFFQGSSRSLPRTRGRVGWGEEFRGGASGTRAMTATVAPTLGAATAFTPAPRWEPAMAYPDPAIRTLDPRFEAIKPPFNAAVERLATGFRWAEGPVWFGDGRYLLWSDIPNNRIMRWNEETCATSVFRKPSNHANGNTRDRQGRLITCEHEGRRVTRTEYDGSITVILDRFDGKRLNSPNDVVVKSDDSIWFSDPAFGILGNYEGDKAEPELPTNVYRVDGSTGQATVVAGDLNFPNGLCFSPDESKLYLVESRARPTRLIHVYEVVEDGTKLANGRVFVNAGDGSPDGFRCDVEGNLWCGWGGSEALNGVVVFAPDATMIGRIALPERCANPCFGGRKRNRLMMAASRSIYSIYVNTQGVLGG